MMNRLIYTFVGLRNIDPLVFICIYKFSSVQLMGTLKDTH